MTTVSTEVVLRANDLGYAYRPDRFAVRHLNVELHRGEILGLLGRNGAGKTTTVRMLTTLLPPTEGTAEVLGQDVRSGGRALRSRLGVVLQSESLDFVTVEQNLVLYAFMWGVPRAVAKARGEEMIELFELQHVRRRKPWALSGGERRRFQVARELMHEMEILFLDEPTVGLDAFSRRRILNYLRERAKRGLSIVFTTHILHEADMLCDRIAVMHEGRLLALETPEVLKERFGGPREVRVQFTGGLEAGDREELERGLQDKGVHLLPPEGAAPEGREIAFRSDRAEAMVAWLASWGASHDREIERLSMSEHTLEGAFLGMVGGEDREEEETEDTPGPGATTSAPEGPRTGARR